MKLVVINKEVFSLVKTKTGHHVQHIKSNKWLSIIVRSQKELELYIKNKSWSA